MAVDRIAKRSRSGLGLHYGRCCFGAHTGMNTHRLSGAQSLSYSHRFVLIGVTSQKASKEDSLYCVRLYLMQGPSRYHRRSVNQRFNKTN
jgi:hypothetical protein